MIHGTVENCFNSESLFPNISSQKGTVITKILIVKMELSYDYASFGCLTLLVGCILKSKLSHEHIPIGPSDFFKRDGASCSATMFLPIGSSDLLKRDGESCSATIFLLIGFSDFFKRDGASCSATIRSSGFRCAYDYKQRLSLFNYYLRYPVE